MLKTLQWWLKMWLVAFLQPMFFFLPQRNRAAQIFILFTKQLNQYFYIVHFCPFYGGRIVINCNINMEYLSCMGLELLHVNGNPFNHICALFLSWFQLSDLFLFNFIFQIDLCFLRGEPWLCDSAIWIERTSDLTLGYYYTFFFFFLHRLNKLSLYFKKLVSGSYFFFFSLSYEWFQVQ